jgi:hypothetical protein
MNKFKRIEDDVHKMVTEYLDSLDKPVEDLMAICVMLDMAAQFFCIWKGRYEGVSVPAAKKELAELFSVVMVGLDRDNSKAKFFNANRDGETVQ